MDETQSENENKGAQLLELGNKWLARIRASETREDDWMKDAEAAEKAYSANSKSKADGKVYDFNILHSNVETIVPAIYNSTPVPDVRSRNSLPQPQMPEPPPQQEGQPVDPKALAAFQQAQQQAQVQQQRIKSVRDFCALLERSIAVQIDDNKLDSEVESCAQDAFLSGRGIVRVRLHVDEAGANEQLSYEAVSWRDFRRGPAKRWNDLPWMAFRHSMPAEEAERFGDKELIASQVKPDAAVRENEEDDIIVWEIWCKEPGRKVLFVRESDGMIIKQEDDPLGLTSFYPTPAPVQPITLTGRLDPTCPFAIYKKLADELDLATKRINAIMKGLKVRGLVAGDLTDVELLSKADDNELIAAKNLEGLAQTGGIEKAIMWWPVDKAIIVLKELYAQREQIKQAIYELTGISDIVRGASNAGETATAQQIKTQWGSLRIQKMQRLIQRLVRDLFIISAEIITTKFSTQTLEQMTGIEITPDIQAMLNEKTLAYYRVDIESDSTVKADTTRIKGEMAEFMAGTGQYFATMGPLVQSDPAMAKPIAAIYTAFARNWNLGKQAEDALEELSLMAEQAGKKPKPNPEAEKAKQEMAMKSADMQADRQMKEMDFAAKSKEREETMQMKREEHGFKMQEMFAAANQRSVEFEQKRQMESDKHSQAMDTRKADTDGKRAEMGLPNEEIMGGLISEMAAQREASTQAIVAVAEAMQQGNQAVADAVNNLAAAQLAPKQIVKDAAGKPVGIQAMVN